MITRGRVGVGISAAVRRASVLVLLLCLACVQAWSADSISSVDLFRGQTLSGLRVQLSSGNRFANSHSLTAECQSVPPDGDPSHIQVQSISGTGSSGFYTFDISVNAAAVYGAYKVRFFDTTTQSPGNPRRELPTPLVVNVVRPETNSTAYLEVRREENGAPGAERYSPLGGRAFVVLVLKIGPNEALSQDMSTLEFRVREASDVHAAEDASAQWDGAFSLEGGWQKKQADGTWAGAEGTPKERNSSGSTQYWRQFVSWDTTRTPLGHNGEHHVKVRSVNGNAQLREVKFATGLVETYEAGPDAKIAECKNLVISSVSPDEHFLVTPRQTAPVYFNVHLDDESENYRYRLVLTIRHTARPEEIIRTIVREGNGHSHRLTWDLNNDSGEYIGTFGGYFTFDLTVGKTGDVEQLYRSEYLKVVEDDLVWDKDEEGNYITRNNLRHGLFRYRLSEIPLAQSVSVTFYDNLEYVECVGDLSDRERWTNSYVDIWTDASSLRGIMSAKDTRASSRRDHLYRRMLNWNKGLSAYTILTCLSYNLTGSPSTPGHLMEWRKILSGDEWPQQSIWRINNSWEANSGTGSRMNSDDIRDYWVKNSGPTPISNPEFNSVSENSEHWVVSLAPYGGLTENADEFSWRDGNGGYIKNSGMYVGYRFKILNQDGEDAHHPTSEAVRSGADNNVRDAFRIHEDNGPIGSIGCTSAKAGQMQFIYERFKEIRKAVNLFNGYSITRGVNIPYHIYDRAGPSSAGTHNFKSISWGADSP